MAPIHLIYVSSARHELDTEELTRILRSAISHNWLQQITGMLLYKNGSFMQVLEGEEDAVDETYGRIQQDPRHTGLMLIERAPIKARSFEDWSMGFKHLGATDIAVHPAYNPVLISGFGTLSGASAGLALEMLKVFASSQGH